MSDQFLQIREILELLEIGLSVSKHRDDLLIEALAEQPKQDVMLTVRQVARQIDQSIRIFDQHETDFFRLSQTYQILFSQDESILVMTHAPGRKFWLYVWDGKRFQGNKLSQRQASNLFQKVFDQNAEIQILASAKTAHIPKNIAETPFQRLRQFMAIEKGNLWLIFFYALTIGFLGLAVPIASQSLVNNVAFGALRQPLAALTMILILVLGFLTLMKSLQLLLVEMLQRRIFVRVAQTSAQRILQVQSQVFDRNPLSEVVNRFFDVVTVQKSASFLLLDGLSIVLATVTGMLLLAFYHPFLLAFDVVLILSILFVVFVLGIGAQRTSIQESSEKYRIAAWLEELASHLLLFKPTAGSEFVAKETDRHLQNYLEARKKHFRIVFRQNVGAFGIQAIAATALLTLGGWLVIEGELSIGQLVAAELVVANVVNSFAKIGKHLETWYDLMASFNKLGYIFDLPAEKLNVGFLANIHAPAQISLKNVSYYSADHSNRLNSINLELQPGSRTAILGANHWDSQRLLELLYGFRQANQGLVLIDDQPLHHLHLATLRSQVVMVRQLELINASVLDNLRLGKPTLSRIEALQVLKQVGLESTLQQFPEGLDTIMHFNGSPFSHAEAYRFMIARALAMKPRLLILDGVLDHIDWKVYGPVSQTLFNELSAQTTLLVVTNQVDLLRHFDAVYYFPNAGQLSPAPASLYLTEGGV